MPIARFLTEASRATRDVGHLLWFRSAATRRRRTSRWGLLIVAVITAGAAIGPAFLGRLPHRAAGHRREHRDPQRPGGLPAAEPGLGHRVGGGRELISRDQAVAFPVSPTTDHLGALLLSPLNVAWMVQVWFLLGATAFAIGGTGALVPAQLVIMLWVLAATAAAQIVAWSAEAVRRGPAGLAIVRTVGALGMAVAGWLYFTGRFGDFLDALPTRPRRRGRCGARRRELVACGSGPWPSCSS